MNEKTDKIGVIDLGTNTFNLLIAEKTSAITFRKLLAHRIPVMLGERTIDSNIICDSAFDRGVNAMLEFSKILNDNKIIQVKALATSALRTSINAKYFINRVAELTGIEINVISGDEEAELIFIGNSTAADLSNEFSLIMDIGGGSTEFIIGNKDGIVWKKSFLLGAARLLSKYMPEDPISHHTIKLMEAHFDQELDELFRILSSVKVIELIGSSGAFDSLAEMIDVEYQSMSFTEKQPLYHYDFSQYFSLAAKIIQSKLKDRMQMKGLIPMRAEMIVISVVFTSYILKKTGVKTFKSTTWSLKEGAVLKWLSEISS